MQPERVLRFLDSVDGMAYAARLACAGYWGRRARMTSDDENTRARRDVALN
jgi:hypothetical protein